MSDNKNASGPAQPAQASETPSSANIGLSAEDHFNNIFRALSSGAALVKLGFDQIRSYFSTPTPTPTKLPSRSAPSICKHIFDLYVDCSETYTCKKYFAPIEKYCTISGKADFKMADSRLTEENEIITPPEEDSVMPIPFRLILWSYYGCIEKKYWDPQRQFVCLEKYTKLLETIVDADKNTVLCDKDAHQHQSVPA